MRRGKLAAMLVVALLAGATTHARPARADYGHDGGTVTSVTLDAADHVTVNWTHPPNDPNLATLGVGEEIETAAVQIGPAGDDPNSVAFVLAAKTYDMPPNDDSLATFTTPDTFAPGSYQAVVIVADYERFDGREWEFCPWNGSYFECKIEVVSAGFAFTVPDTSAPSSVPGLNVVPRQRSVAVAWGQATDNVGVVGYRLFRDGTKIADVTSLGYLDAGLAPRSTHSYTVQAYDAAGNVGPLSAALTVAVPAVPVVKKVVKNAKVTAICKDGTKSTKKLRRTACVGHHGVRKWLGAK